MNTLFLTEDDVRTVLNMPTSILVVEEAFRQWSLGNAMNVPRRRAGAAGILLHSLSAGADYLGYVGWKNYTTTRSSARFLLMLYDCRSGQPVVLMEADWLGRYRTGATSGVATKYLAKRECRAVGLFGTGRQARTQLEAVCAIRPIEFVQVWGRDPGRLEQFTQEMSQRLQIRIEAHIDPNTVARDKDIVVTATSSQEPLFSGDSLSPGSHLNLIGSNHPLRTEVDVATIGRSDRIVCDSLEQCQFEAGDFTQALEQGVVEWSAMTELRDLIAGVVSGRDDDRQITLFKSVGLGLEDVALAAEVFQRARARGLGQPLPF